MRGKSEGIPSHYMYHTAVATQNEERNTLSVAYKKHREIEITSNISMFSYTVEKFHNYDY